MHFDWLYWASHVSSHYRNFCLFSWKHVVRWPQTHPLTLEKSQAWPLLLILSLGVSRFPCLPQPLTQHSFQNFSTLFLNIYPTAKVAHCSPVNPILILSLTYLDWPGVPFPIIISHSLPVSPNSNPTFDVQLKNIFDLLLCDTPAFRICFLFWVYWPPQVPCIWTLIVDSVGTPQWAVAPMVETKISLLCDPT